MSIHDLMSARSKTEAIFLQLGLEIIEQKEIPYGHQYTVRSGGSRAQLNVYFGKKGLKLVAQGSDNEAKQGLGKVIAILDGRDPAEDDAMPTVWKETKGHANVEFAFNEPWIGTDESGNQDSYKGVQIRKAYDEPWIGSDESGKGDFFGGLVTAGVIVDPEAVPLLQSLGVDDSKKINDTKIPSMATEIRKICYGKYKVLSLVPSKYNDLYERLKGEGKNLNSLLAWAHVSVLENLLEVQKVNLAIADKFADEKYINSRLKKLGRTIELIQVPKAEHNIAVAAASILARDAFLRWHQDAKKQFGVTFPKGANAQVVKVGRSYVQANGKQALRNVAKLHFKTTEEVLQ